MLYGKPTKHIRHVNEASIVLEPQRFFIHRCWAYDAAATSRTDGLDLTASGGAKMPEGSRIDSHKFEILITPKTIEPQQIYIGRLKLSFNDVYSSAISGGRFQQASFGDAATEQFNADTTPITPNLFADDGETAKILVKGYNTNNLEIGGSGSGKGITDWFLDDHIGHWINLKKITVFDQRPLMGDRWQRIPSKVKRINEGCFYGIMFFNDSVRGGTPADTDITINIKERITEMAI